MENQTQNQPQPNVLFRHNMGNLKLHYPQLHQQVAHQQYQPIYQCKRSQPNEPFQIIKNGASSPDRGENGIIHPAEPIEDAKQYVEQLNWDDHQYIFVINTGLGFLARQLGERLFLESFQFNQKRALILVEEDIELFRLSLQLHNWDVNFWQPQVMWIVGTPISKLHEHPFFREHPNLFLYDPLIIPGGMQSQREAGELASFQSKWSVKREQQKEAVQQEFSSLQIRQKHFPIEGKKRVLFLSINQQRELQKSIAHTFQHMGWDCRMLSPKSHPQYGHHVHGFYSQWTWLHTLKDYDADFIFLLNYIPSDTHMQESLTKLNIPIIVWYVDDPKRDRDLPNMKNIDTSNFFIFCYDKNHMPFLQQNGFEHVYYMPVGTVMSPDRLNRRLIPKHDGVSYVGSLMTGEAIMNSRVLSVHFPQWYDWLQTALKEIQRGKWYDEIDCLQNKPFPEGNALSPTTIITYLQDAVTNQYRTGVLERMTKHNLRTYGGKDLLAEACSPVLKQAYQGKRVSYHEELPAVYAQSAVNLNLNHFQTTHGIAQRIYDALAVGGFIITDTNPAITESFTPKEEIICAESIDEMDDLAGYYLRHPSEREAIIQKGQEKVLAHDTLDQRLQEIMKNLAESIK